MVQMDINSCGRDSGARFACSVPDKCSTHSAPSSCCGCGCACGCGCSGCATGGTIGCSCFDWGLLRALEDASGNGPATPEDVTSCFCPSCLCAALLDEREGAAGGGPAGAGKGGEGEGRGEFGRLVSWKLPMSVMEKKKRVLKGSFDTHLLLDERLPKERVANRHTHSAKDIDCGHRSAILEN
jgi:hypothetical protein